MEFIVAKLCAEGCFLNIVWVDAYLVVPRTKVNLGEDLGVMDLVHEVVNAWDGIPVFLGNLVEAAVSVGGREIALQEECV